MEPRGPAADCNDDDNGIGDTDHDMLDIGGEDSNAAESGSGTASESGSESEAIIESDEIEPDDIVPEAEEQQQQQQQEDIEVYKNSITKYIR